MNLASRLRAAFFRHSSDSLAGLLERIREESQQRHLVYLHDGHAETVRLLPCPLPFLADQLAYIQYVSLTIQNALKRLPDLYMQDFAVRDTLRLTPPEEQWLWDCWGPSHEESNPVFGRLDAVADPSSPMWKDSLRFLEPNMSGIGGLHLVPTSERIIRDVVFPVLRERDPALEFELGADVRELLMQEILDHLELIGRSASTLCFLEPKYARSGIDEQEEVARFIRQRYGLEVMHADPSELTFKGEEVFYQGTLVDLAYRDYSVLDLMELQRQGHSVEPMKRLFRSNRIVSSVAAELDQKACWEVLTDPQYTHRFFRAEERQVFRRHLLWTRWLGDRPTRLPDGETGELLAYARAERETLVIKPNRAWGGEGVLIGLAASEADWDRALEAAVRAPHDWVVQQLAAIPVTEFPVIDPSGAVRAEPFYTVLGFAPSKYGLAVMGRASQKQVVNIAQRGGLCVIAIGQPAGELFGPDSAQTPGAAAGA